MSIWIGDPTIEIANEKGVDTLNRNLGIELTELTENSLEGRMPVDERTKQPAGVLHGGASVALAETLASSGVDLRGGSQQVPLRRYGDQRQPRPTRELGLGARQGDARLALGRKTHVWEIKIVNDEDKLVCISRCTMAVLETPSQY